MQGWRQDTSRGEQIAEEIGRDQGKNAASWYFDGNTDRETYERVLRGIDEGDPAVYDTFPSSPLSGEWADSYSLADLSDDTAVAQDDDSFDDVCRAYEDAFDSAVQESIEQAARLDLGA